MSRSSAGWSKLAFLVANDVPDVGEWPQADPFGEAGHEGCWPLVSPALIAASTVRA
jgi:hypothetical protein